MKFRSVKYYFEEAFKGVVRNNLMSVTSMLTVASCMLILIFSFCIAVNVDYILEQLETKAGISVYVDDGCSDAQVELIHDKIMTIENVKDVKYISKEEALQTLVDRMETEQQAAFVQGLENDNPLPRSFEISLYNAREQDETISKLETLKDDGIYKINDQRTTTNILIAINNVVRIVSVFIVFMLGLLSVVIIMNTIKLTVNNRKTDINIMKYVGATDWFIKWPFIIEGAIIGVIGAIVPAVIINVSYDGIMGIIGQNMGAISRLFEFKSSVEIFPLLFPIIIVLGTILGVLGSTLSMKKYLNV